VFDNVFQPPIEGVKVILIGERVAGFIRVETPHRVEPTVQQEGVMEKIEAIPAQTIGDGAFFNVSAKAQVVIALNSLPRGLQSITSVVIAKTYI